MLEAAVGAELATRMSDHALREYDRLMGLNEEDALLAHLRDHVPGYAAVVEDCFNRLKREVAESSGRIMIAVEKELLGIVQVEKAEPQRARRAGERST